MRPGEAATVLCLASDKAQARIALRYTKAYFEEIELLRPLVERETQDGLELSNDVELLVLSSNFRSVRGRTIALAILDEVAFMRSDNSASPDFEVYAALRPSMATIPNSLLVGISSPYRRSGLLFTKWRDHFGKDDDNVLVIRAPTRLLNPSLPESEIAEAMERDPVVARTEWFAEWRSDIEAFLPLDVVEGCVSSGVIVRAPLDGVNYAAACDPAGGSGQDSMTLAICHAEGTRIVLDCVVEKRPPFSPQQTTREFCDVLKSYRCGVVTGDRFAGSWPSEQFAENGITYRPSELNRSEGYLAFVPLIMSGRVDLLDHPRMVKQFVELERKTAPSGRQSIDHNPNGGHDDIANSVALAAVLAAAKPWRQPVPFTMPFSVSRARNFPGQGV